MSALRFVARVVFVAVLCAVATALVGWLGVVVVGFVYGLVDRAARSRGSVAALGAASAWTSIIAESAMRGDNVADVAARMGGVLQVPGWTFFTLTLCFGAILCGCAAVIASAFIDSALPRRDRHPFRA